MKHLIRIGRSISAFHYTNAFAKERTWQQPIGGVREPVEARLHVGPGGGSTSLGNELESRESLCGGGLGLAEYPCRLRVAPDTSNTLELILHSYRAVALALRL